MMLWRGLCKEGIQLCLQQAHRCAGTYSRPSLKDHYQVLCIGRKATGEEIKNAFFTLSKKAPDRCTSLAYIFLHISIFNQCHPDSDPSNPLLHSQFVRLNEAYRVLSKHSSRAEYDQVLEAIEREKWSSAGRSPYTSYSKSYKWNHSYQTEQGPYTRSTSENHERYWSEFPPKRDWEESAKQRGQRNTIIVIYCFLVAGLSIFVHWELFSTFREIRRKEMDEEQRRILKFYNERKEAARLNGLSMQQEILVQRHEEKLRQLYGLQDQTKK